MPDVLTTIEFDEWVRGLSIMGKAKVLARITNMERGNLGDCEPVGEGVSESRINWGPGLRLYFVERGDRFIILLGGEISPPSSKISTRLWRVHRR